MYSTTEALQKLIEATSAHPGVVAIGMSGSGKLPTPGKGDIDLFVYCQHIPSIADRTKILARLGDCAQESSIDILEKGHWGTGDCLLLNGIETWLMYFTTSAALAEVEQILSGDTPYRLDNYYYPLGRCAMLQTINILYDANNFLAALQTRLAKYPDHLQKKTIEYNLEELQDTEDLERAITQQDLLFYHFALDKALDHFLHTLFALNRVFFPSRKRSLTYIHTFPLQPSDCAERLTTFIRLGSAAETLTQSYAEWDKLVKELDSLCDSPQLP